MSVDADKLVGAYIKIRTAREELKKQFDEEDAKLLSKQDLIKAKLLETCKTNNQDGIKTAHGTATRIIKTRYYTNDWSAMHEFIMERNLPQLLENRISQKNMKEYIEQNPEDMPIGMNLERKYDIQIRKA